MDFLDSVHFREPSRTRMGGSRWRCCRRLFCRSTQCDSGEETLPLFAGRKSASVDHTHPDNQRSIILGGQQVQRFITNKICTAKYGFLSFLPKFFYEQFRKYANLFFLFIGCLQQIPDVSPTGRYTTIVPLICILILSAIKEIIEDIKRHLADKQVNYSKVLVLVNDKWEERRWKDLKVGDCIKLLNGALIPADVILLSSSESQGIAYVETANLDGETNLKIRKAVSKTSHAVTANQLSELSGKIVCEGPNRYLYDFIGTIHLNELESGVSLGPQELLLRGSKLKNTTWAFGVVVYTGEESKLRLNSIQAPLKRSHLEKVTNVQILLLFGILLFISLLTAVCNIVWAQKYADGIWYEDTHVRNFILQFLTYIILYNNLIPISLQVTLEFVKFVQAFFINWDMDMYHHETDTPAAARTSNLNEELGQVKYIFSDKTGTLTRNVMEFKGCSINGVVYRDDNLRDTISKPDVCSFEVMKSRESSAHPDAKLIDDFMRFLVLCHTVVPEKVEDADHYQYQASSPDEGALVSGAQDLGWIFTARTPETLTISHNGQDESYQLLNVIDFTSARKRMSVIVRNAAGSIKLLSKGADSVIFERLKPGQSVVNTLNLQLTDFATAGLRTLCLAERIIDEGYYRDWNTRFQAASCAIENREKSVASLADEIEQDLTLIGATAVEDKLQEGVPECIASLAKADIKIWVLTGDKQETAINIGYACKLLNKDMPLMMINGESLESTRHQVMSAIEEFGATLKHENNVSLIIDGHTLKHALKQQIVVEFLKVAVSCRSVICCRVSPLQKAELVALVKKYVGAITLAVGDGANDVGMIQAADVGVGINGLEGTQAVCAADYSIGQFRFLKKLLLVHGTWSYYRICKLVLYSFYKNVCIYIIELWFQMYNGFSGQILFERWSIGFFNVIFTFFPPLALGLLDRYTDTEITMKYPQMYKISQDSTLFNVKVFWMWMINAIYQSMLLYFIPLIIMGSTNIEPSGTSEGYLFLGNSVFGYTVVTVCLKAGLESNTWTWMHFLAIFGSIFSWFLYVLVYSEAWPSLPIGDAESMAGQSRRLFSTPMFWLCLLLVPILALLRDFVWKIFRRTFFVSIKEKVEIFHKTPINYLTMRSRQNSTTGAAHASVASTENGSNKAATNFFKKLFAPAAIYTFNPSDHSLIEVGESQHGFAFSQDEHAYVRPSQVVRIIDSTVQKPEGV